MKETNKVLHPPYTGARGELYEILWKYASGGGGEESRIPCDEIDNIITDILKLQAGKCHCGGYPDCICEISKKSKSDPHNDIYGPGLDNYGRDKLLYGPDPAIKLMKDRFSDQEIVNEAMDLASKKCGKSELATQPKQTAGLRELISNAFDENSSDANNGQMSVITEDSYSDLIDEIIEIFQPQPKQREVTLVCNNWMPDKGTSATRCANCGKDRWQHKL